MKFAHASDIDRLIEEQAASWPMLARGMEGLRHALTKPVDVNGFRIQVRHLPHRIVSTTANVDPDSVAKRPCFLCPSNLPPEEEGLEFNDDYTIYCNPFPILEKHLTIVHRHHRPQRIAGQIENMLALAEALPGFFVIYNGARCGASAPDHLHFQACWGKGVPIIDQGLPSFGLRVDPVLAESIIGTPEPLVNIAAFRDGGETVVVVFRRSKHRPAVFHSGELTVSPATIDLCGVFVTPVEKDFHKITGDDIRRIIEEVTIP